MSHNSKRKKPQRRELPDPDVLDSIGSPNAWTPKDEDAWLKELKKISAREIYERFPPVKKPSNVALRGKSYG